jgi:hypothetical protein
MSKIIFTAIPFIWIIGLLPFANQVKPFVFGLPFVAFWLMTGIIVTFICTSVLYKLFAKKPD